MNSWLTDWLTVWETRKEGPQNYTSKIHRKTTITSANTTNCLPAWRTGWLTDRPGELQRESRAPGGSAGGEDARRRRPARDRQRVGVTDWLTSWKTDRGWLDYLRAPPPKSPREINEGKCYRSFDELVGKRHCAKHLPRGGIFGGAADEDNCLDFFFLFRFSFSIPFFWLGGDGWGLFVCFVFFLFCNLVFVCFFPFVCVVFFRLFCFVTRVFCFY